MRENGNAADFAPVFPLNRAEYMGECGIRCYSVGRPRVNRGGDSCDRE